MKSLLALLLLLWGAIYLFPLQPQWPKVEIPFIPPKEEIKKEDDTLLFLGDIMLGRHVEKLMDQHGNEYPFSLIKETLASSTYVVGNLEGPIPEKHVPTKSMGFQFSFKKTVAEVIKDIDIDALSLANNHASDWGEGGWQHTIEVLNNAEVVTFGHARRTVDDFFATKVGTTTVIVYGINMVTPKWNEKVALEVTKRLRERYKSAHIIAFIHWGEEYKHDQGSIQRKFAHKLVDLGVDAIVGTHPHVVQGIETYNNKPIFYSLGNFVFDQYFSKEVQDGYILRLKDVGDSFHYEIIPIVSSSSRPRLAVDGERESILETIAENSFDVLKESILTGGITVKQ